MFNFELKQKFKDLEENLQNLGEHYSNSIENLSACNNQMRSKIEKLQEEIQAIEAKLIITSAAMKRLTSEEHIEQIFDSIKAEFKEKISGRITQMENQRSQTPCQNTSNSKTAT